MKELTLDATVANIEVVTDFVNAELEALDCPIKAQYQIDIAIDELFSNIANYAYGADVGPATVRFEAVQDPRKVVMTFIDQGLEFDPLSASAPNIQLAADERSTGGLGIFMVRKTMDGMSYERRDGKNILRVEKNL